MTSEQAFVSALEKLPDIYIQRLVDYIDSEHKFIKFDLGRGEGVGCVTGVIMGAHELHPMELWVSDRCQEYIDFTKGNDIHYNLVNYNNENAEKPILYQLILKEAERRGLIKKELEPIEIKDESDNGEVIVKEIRD